MIHMFFFRFLYSRYVLQFYSWLVVYFSLTLAGLFKLATGVLFSFVLRDEIIIIIIVGKRGQGGKKMYN